MASIATLLLNIYIIYTCTFHFQQSPVWWYLRQSWWRHQLETFSALLALCEGNSPAPVNSPHKGQWRGTLMFSLICAWINDWVNNHEAGDLRPHHGHYYVNVMSEKMKHKYPYHKTRRFMYVININSSLNAHTHIFVYMLMRPHKCMV